MRRRGSHSLRWLATWLIAALLFAQHGAMAHALSHVADLQGRAAAAAPDSGKAAAHDLACAQCLASAVLDHVAPTACSPEVAAEQASAPFVATPAGGASRAAPPARSRGPPPAFS